MSKPRTEAQWYSLSKEYRSRLERKGITRSSYMAGANLQEARGQAKEKRTSEAVKRGEIPRGQSPSHLRALSRNNEPLFNRAKARGITRAQFEDAIETHGLAAVQKRIREQEQANREWRKKGSPKKYKLNGEEKVSYSSDYSGPRYDPDELVFDYPEPDEDWDDVFSYYH